MTLLETRGALRCLARAVLAASALLGAVHGASADDGLRGFFSAIFGGAPQSAPLMATLDERPPAVGRAWPLRRGPLVVRLHPAKPRFTLADAPAKAGRVSIFEDRTLRRGDAVMMRDGVRVFAGSASWPYRPTDFVRLDDARQLGRNTSEVLAQLDKAPRS